jgi:hypothetical protein
MLVGIDSEVTITYLNVEPHPDNPTSMELSFTYHFEVYGANDQAFSTDISKAVAHKLSLVLNESIS